MACPAFGSAVVWLLAVGAFAGECPRWISVMPFHENQSMTDVCDAVDLVENTIVDGIAYSCPVNPIGDPVENRATSYAKCFSEMAPLIRRKSTARVGVLMQATMGHGGEPGKRTPWQLAVHADGKVTYRFCPLDKRFLDYMAKVSRTFSDVKPDFFMVDDDTRLIWGVPGCFCPLHLAEFERRTGRKWTREEVVARIKADDREIVSQWLQLKKESLATFFRTIRDGYDASIPGVLCVVGSPEHFINAREFAEILAAPGQMPVVRGSGAPYYGNELETIAFHRARYAGQLAALGRNVVVLQESDTCPHTRWATSSTRLVNHMVMLALEGVKGAKIWITRPEIPEWRSRAAYRKAFREKRGLMEWAAKADFHQKGVVIPTVPLRSEGCCEENWGCRYFSRVGVPYRIGREAKGEVVALNGEMVEELDDDGLRRILSGPVLLDGTAAIRLSARGFSADIGVEARPWAGRTVQREVFADGAHIDRGLRSGSSDFSSLAKGTQIRSRLMNRSNRDVGFECVAPGSFYFENERGGRVLAFAQSLTECRPPYGASVMYSETFRAQVVSALQVLCGTFPGGVYYLGDEPMMLEVGETGDGENVFVMDNLDLDDEETPELVFVRVPRTIERLSNDGSWSPVRFTVCTNGVCRMETCIRTQSPAIFRWKCD